MSTNGHVHHAHVLECQTYVAKVMRFKDGLVQWVGFNRKKMVQELTD